MRMFLLALILSFVAGAPAAAEFYIVQDKATEQCQVVPEKPSGGSLQLAGDGRAYATRIEAEAAIKTIRGCEGAAAGRTPAAK